MSHGPPLASGDYFDFGVDGSDGQPVVDNGQAFTPASMQPSDNAMMMLFNDPAAFFDSYEDVSHVLGTSAAAGTTLAPAEPALPHASFPPVFSGTVHDGPTKDSDTADTPTGGSGNTPGAGPLPVDAFRHQSGAAVTSSMAATLTEFTRRKNWPSKVVEELCDLLLIIEPSGRLKFASPNIKTLLGYGVDEAVGQSLTELVHPDDRFVLISELNACIANASLLRMYLRLRKKDGTYAIVETVGHPHIAAPRFAPNPSNKSPFCQAVFLMSRPYPTKNAKLLDSFLEHKMENERLRRRIDDLRREEESEDRDDESHVQSQTQTQSQSQGQGLLWPSGLDDRSDSTATVAASALPGGANPSPVYFRAGGGTTTGLSYPDGVSMPPPSMLPLKTGSFGGVSLGPGIGGSGLNNAALTRENLEGIDASRPDSLRDKMARYEGMHGPGSATGSAASGLSTGAAQNAKRTGPMGTTTPADTIEMLTGLRYQEGERSRGLSTGNRSPRLIKGDAGIDFSVNRDQRSGEKKKKIRLAEEYVCTDCGRWCCRWSLLQRLECG